jgi:hypothetical protein
VGVAVHLGAYVGMCVSRGRSRKKKLEELWWWALTPEFLTVKRLSKVED